MTQPPIEANASRGARPAPSTADLATTTSDAARDEDALVEDEVLIEDVSIDGMCGVY